MFLRQVHITIRTRFNTCPHVDGLFSTFGSFRRQEENKPSVYTDTLTSVNRALQHHDNKSKHSPLCAIGMCLQMLQSQYSVGT